MNKKKELTLEEYLGAFTDTELEEALEKFVAVGVLMRTTKDGEIAYKNNPEFLTKSAQEQKRILASLT